METGEENTKGSPSPEIGTTGEASAPSVRRISIGRPWRWLIAAIVLAAVSYPLARGILSRDSAGAEAGNLLNQSFQLYQAHRYQESIAAAKALLKADPNSADAYNNIAAAYAELRMWDEAIENAQAALRIRPVYPLARNNLAWALGEKQKIDSTRITATTPDACLGLSFQFYQAGKYPESISAARQALKLKPGLPEAYNNIAAAYSAMRLWDEAIDAAHEALRLKPDFQLARNNLAWSESQKKIETAKK